MVVCDRKLRLSYASLLLTRFWKRLNIVGNMYYYATSSPEALLSVGRWLKARRSVSVRAATQP